MCIRDRKYTWNAYDKHGKFPYKRTDIYYVFFSSRIKVQQGIQNSKQTDLNSPHYIIEARIYHIYFIQQLNM